VANNKNYCNLYAYSCMLKFRTYRGNRYAGIGLDEDLFQLLRMQLWKRYWNWIGLVRVRQLSSQRDCMGVFWHIVNNKQFPVQYINLFLCRKSLGAHGKKSVTLS